MASPRPYAPSDLDATNFAALEPHYRELLDRPVRSADDLEQLILDRSDLDALVAEKSANLYIATTRNTEDKAAEAAYLGFVREVEPKLKPVASTLDRKIATSPHADALPSARYEVLLRALRVDIELFREANIPLETELAELDQKYNQTIGRMTVEFEGKTRTMPQMSRYLEEGDRALRERAWKAINDRRLQDRDAIDDIYDAMLGLRHRIALNAGFDNFRDFQHRRFKRFDYVPADCMSMHAAIEEHLVPIQRRLDAERARALATSPLRPWDLSVDVKGRKPLRPFDGAQQLIDGFQMGFKVYRGRIGFMDFLEDVYDTIKNGGEVFCSNVDESQFLKFERDDAHVHMDRMASVPGLKCRFLIKDGDMNVISSHYAVYKHSQPEDFGTLPIYIFGDKTGFILFSEDDVNVYVIEDPFISRFFRMEFLKLWKRAKDIPL
jgi:hypothetical protein